MPGWKPPLIGRLPEGIEELDTKTSMISRHPVYYSKMALRKISVLTRKRDARTLHLTAMLLAMVLGILSVLLLASCAPSQRADKAVAMPNPASVYCSQQGGSVENIQRGDGEAGFCHLPDGRIVDEWEYYRSQFRKQGS